MPVKLIIPPRFADDRGWFSETWNARAFAANGITANFCQDNHSYSRRAGTLRGLHYQNRPHAQAKLVRCLRGRIFDVAVDLRRSSPTFRDWVGTELTAAGGEQLFVPAGFAHGFLTLEDECEVAYKVDAYWSKEAEMGIAWDDPELAVAWPLGSSTPILSAKDAVLPRLAEAAPDFDFDGTPLLPLGS